jgi:hypothetical protein
MVYAFSDLIFLSALEKFSWSSKRKRAALTLLLSSLKTMPKITP